MDKMFRRERADCGMVRVEAPESGTSTGAALVRPDQLAFTVVGPVHDRAAAPVRFLLFEPLIQRLAFASPDGSDRVYHTWHAHKTHGGAVRLLRGECPQCG